MENNQEYTEKIIQYLDGELTGSELAEFEKLLSTDSSVSQELENLELAKSAIESYGLKQHVASMHKKMIEELRNDKQDVPVRKIYPLMSVVFKIAASLVIALLAFGVYQYVTVSSSSLYQDSNQPYKLSVSRGEGRTSELEKNYASGDFKQTAAAFEELAQPTLKDDLLGGQAYMQTQQAPKAIAAFNKVLADNSANNIFKDDAEYYLAESYLENNEPLKAKPLFEKIYADNDHLYHDRISYWSILKLRILALKTPGK